VSQADCSMHVAQRHCYLTVSGHVSLHTAVGGERHVTQTARVFLNTGMRSDVSLQHSTRHKRLETFHTEIRLLTWYTSTNKLLLASNRTRTVVQRAKRSYMETFVVSLDKWSNSVKLEFR